MGGGGFLYTNENTLSPAGWFCGFTLICMTQKKSVPQMLEDFKQRIRPLPRDRGHEAGGTSAHVIGEKAGIQRCCAGVSC